MMIMWASVLPFSRYGNDCFNGWRFLFSSRIGLIVNLAQSVAQTRTGISHLRPTPAARGRSLRLTADIPGKRSTIRGFF